MEGVRPLSRIAVVTALLLAAACGGEPPGRGTAALLPREPLPGWHREAVRHFNRGDLYEYMDGGAERYLSTGFRGLDTCLYRGGDREIRVEIYELDTGRDARSLFLEEQGPGFRATAAGEQGARGRLTLLFFRDRFYVRLMSLSRAPGAADLLPDLAAALDRRLRGRQEER